MMSNTSATAVVKFLSQLNSGDEEGFDFFFHLYYPLLKSLALRLVGDDNIAEEVVQDAFYKVWCKRGIFDEVGALKAYLYVSVRNASLNEIHKRDNREKYQHAYADQQNDVDLPIVHEIIRLEVKAILTQALERLPPQCSRIMQYLFEQELTPAEVASLMGISVSTVNNQKARGLSLLRKDLGDQAFVLVVVGLSIPNW